VPTVLTTTDGYVLLGAVLAAGALVGYAVYWAYRDPGDGSATWEL